MPDPKKDLQREDYLPNTVETKMGLPLSRTCGICKTNDPDLIHEVNRMLTTAEPISKIVQMLNDWSKDHGGKKFWADSVERHRDKHVPFKQKALRKIVEQNAKRYHMDVVNGEENLLSAAAYAEVMMHKGFSTLVDDSVVVSPEQGLKAAQTLENIRREEEDMGNQYEQMVQMQRLLSAVREEVDPAVWPKIMRRVAGEPIVKPSGHKVIEADADDDDIDDDYEDYGDDDEGFEDDLDE